MAFNISDLQKLGEDAGNGDSGPGVLDPFASLPIRKRGEGGWLTQITVENVVFSTDAGRKPAGLQPSKGFDRKMHYVAIECKVTLVDGEALQIIEHPEDEPLPSRTEEVWLYLMPAENRAWTPEEKEALADKVKRAEKFLAPLYDAISMPLQAFDGKPIEGIPASVTAAVKGRKGPLGKVINGDWAEAKGVTFEGEITRREWNGKDYYDHEITGRCAPDAIGCVTDR